MRAASEMTLETICLNRPYYLSEGGLRGIFLSLTARDASTKPKCGRVSIATAQRPSGEVTSIYRGARNVFQS